MLMPTYLSERPLPADDNLWKCQQHLFFRQGRTLRGSRSTLQRNHIRIILDSYWNHIGIIFIILDGQILRPPNLGHPFFGSRSGSRPDKTYDESLLWRLRWWSWRSDLDLGPKRTIVILWPKKHITLILTLILLLIYCIYIYSMILYDI